ncbi:unnamed protein product [Closterium sp. Naga37s-1]|nr:unnamed protein product [Closterium sp. Naga37s-1]CAI5527485.1 unnamed protein product [Closterium sp. Naga37s-1]
MKPDFIHALPCVCSLLLEPGGLAWRAVGLTMCLFACCCRAPREEDRAVEGGALAGDGSNNGGGGRRASQPMGAGPTTGPHDENVPPLSEWDRSQAFKRARRDSDSGSISIDIFEDEELRSPSAGRRMRRGLGSSGEKRRVLQPRVEVEGNHERHAEAAQESVRGDMGSRGQTSEVACASNTGSAGPSKADGSPDYSSAAADRAEPGSDRQGREGTGEARMAEVAGDERAEEDAGTGGCEQRSAAGEEEGRGGEAEGGERGAGKRGRRKRGSKGEEEVEGSGLTGGLSELGMEEERVQGFRQMLEQQRGQAVAAGGASSGAGGGGGAGAGGRTEEDFLRFDHTVHAQDDPTVVCKRFPQHSRVPTFPAGPPQQVNPWSPSLRASLLAVLQPPLSSEPGYHRHSEPLHVPARLKALREGKAGEPVDLRLGSRSYEVDRLLGKGAYARVYGAMETPVGAADAATESTVVFRTVALKLHSKACPWEFYIYRQIQLRIDGPQRQLFGTASAYHEFSNASILTCSLGTSGTLQDVVNAFKRQGKPVPEPLCAFYTAQMLRAVEALHAAHILHGDIKPDNFLLRFGADSESPREMVAAIEAGAPSTGLTLVDYGRSIDMRHFPEGSSFVSDSGTENFRCPEMEEGRPWTTQADLYAVCATAYCLLHGQYMEVERVPAGEGGASGAADVDGCDDDVAASSEAENVSYYRPRLHLKRYWNHDMWHALFHTYLNVPAGQPAPPPAPIRRRFERYSADHASDVSVLLRRLRNQL